MSVSHINNFFDFKKFEKDHLRPGQKRLSNVVDDFIKFFSGILKLVEKNKVQ